MRIILASSSPRRQMLLKSAGFDLKIIDPLVDETQLANEAPDVYVKRLAEAKARYVAHDNEFPVIAADTIVVLDSQVLGKPVDAPDAREMLTRLSGRTHEVYTGFAVRRAEVLHVGMVITKVSFRSLLPHEIDAYLISGEPFDKAGAYGIQGLGASLVDRIEGSFTNVIGLPLKEVIEALGK